MTCGAIVAPSLCRRLWAFRPMPAMADAISCLADRRRGDQLVPAPTSTPCVFLSRFLCFFLYLFLYQSMLADLCRSRDTRDRSAPRRHPIDRFPRDADREPRAGVARAWVATPSVCQSPWRAQAAIRGRPRGRGTAAPIVVRNGGAFEGLIT